MWPFKRRNKQDQSDVPPEIQDYYQSERRERTGIAWLLALATLAVTVVLAIILFFGGRWLYRTFFGNDTQNGAGTSQQQEQEQQDEQEGQQDNTKDENTDGDEDGAVLPGEGSDTDGISGTNGDDGTAESSDGDGQVQGSTGTTPQTGSSDLPKTGPDEMF